MTETQFGAIRGAFIGTVLGFVFPVVYILSLFVSSVSKTGTGPNGANILQWIQVLLAERFDIILLMLAPAVILLASVGALLEGPVRHSFHTAKRTREEDDESDLFLGVLTDDIQSPVELIKRDLIQLKDRDAGPLNAAQLRLIDSVLKKTSVISDLLNDLTALSRQRPWERGVEHVPTDITNVICRAIDEINPLVESDGLTLDFQSKLDRRIRLQGSAFHLAYLIRLVLRNAVNYAPKSSVVSLYLFKNDTGQIQLDVRDKGHSIPEEKFAYVLLKKGSISNPVQKREDGTHLLAAAKIIQMHRGRLWLENTKPEGFCFHMTFPYEN